MPSLENQRLIAAKASCGASSDIIYNRIIQIVEGYNLRGRLLDYGAGVGHLTRRLWAMHRFEEVHGIDLLPRPDDLSFEIAWHCLDLNQEGPLPADTFDTLIAAEVIEHLENPRLVAREWYRLLKPGGVVVLSTPNNESIRSLLSLVMRGHYVEFDDSCYPAHITPLLRKDLARILSEAGFSDVRFQFSDRGGVPRLPTVSWQQVSLGLLKGCRFSDNVIAIAVK